jgi:trehalose 2-sulfotransferase
MQSRISSLVCGTPRSGSSLLCEALITTGIAGQPEEFFLPQNEVLWQERWQTATYAEYLAHTIQQCTTPNGVFCVKMMMGYFDDFVSKLRQIPDYAEKPLSVHNLLQTVFPNLHYIWIRRRDKVRQAVSHAKARQTNVWKVTTNILAPPDQFNKPVSDQFNKPVFSFEQIDYMTQELVAQDAAWQHYFTENNIQPFVVEYEDFVLRYEETAIQILDYLGIPKTESATFAARSMKKQADEESEQWVQHYHHLKKKSRRHRLISQANKVLVTFSQAKRLKSFVS